MMTSYFKRQVLETPQDMRKKVSRDVLEEKLLMVSFVCNVGDAIKQRIPIIDADLKTEWYDKIVNGESTLVLELECSLNERSSI